MLVQEHKPFSKVQLLTIGPGVVGGTVGGKAREGKIEQRLFVNEMSSMAMSPV